MAAPNLSRQVSDLRLETNFHESSTEHVVQRTGDDSVRERWRSHKKRPVLGRGSYGVVRLEQSESNPAELRAVKEVKKSDSNGNAIDYTRELEAIIKFSHSEFKHRFVCSGGWFEDDASVFIVMEYLRYGDLNRHVKSPIAESDAKEIIGQILEGLDHMHGQGFLHRDLKPGNIMVVAKRPTWKVKIADFGVSKQRHLTTLSANTFCVGTLGYAAPEQLAVGKPPDLPVHGKEADLWSVGIITFRIVSGKLPFPHTQALSKYTFGEVQLPLDQLETVKASKNAENFIRGLLVFQPHERMSARTSLSHPWMASTTASKHMQLSLLSDSTLNHNSHRLSQISEMPSAQWSDVRDSTLVRLSTHSLPSEQQELTNQTLTLHTLSESLPPRVPDPAEKPSLLKRQLQSAQIGVVKTLVEDQDYEEATLRVKQLLGSYDFLDSTQQDTVVNLASLSFIEVTEPMEEAQVYFGQNEKFKAAFLQSLIVSIQKWCAAQDYESALTQLKPALGKHREFDPEQQKIIVELAALAFIETITPIEEVQVYFDDNDQLRVAYEQLRVEKVEEWFRQDRPLDIIKLLFSFQTAMLPRWSPNQPSAYSNADHEIQLRMRLAECLNSTNNARKARSVLENLLAFMADSHNQRAPAHIMLSETLSSETYEGADPKWKILAKDHAEKGATLYMDARGPADPTVLDAVMLVADLSEQLDDSDQQAWKQVLADVRISVRIAELKKLRANKHHRRKYVQPFIDCQIQMMDVSRTNPDQAATIGLDYLDSKFTMARSEDYCRQCADQYFRMSSFSWSALTPPGWDSCKHSDDKTMVFSPLHFFALARRKFPQGKQNETSSFCAQEISCLLEMANTERFHNHVINYRGRGTRDVQTPITPLWLAALWGQHNIVTQLLFRQLIRPEIGFHSIQRLGFDTSLKSVGGKSVEEKILKILQRISQEELEICLKGTTKNSYPHWPWCFASQEILVATLKKLGESNAKFKIPWNLHLARNYDEEVNSSLITILLAFPIAEATFPMARKAALESLLRLGAKIDPSGPTLTNTIQQRNLKPLNAIGMGLRKAVKKLEDATLASNSSSGPEAGDWNALSNEVKTSIAMAHMVIKALPSFTPDGDTVNERLYPSLNYREWNTSWAEVTSEFFSFESKTRVVRLRDKMLHRIGKPERPRIDNPRFRICLLERVGPRYDMLGWPRETDKNWRHNPDVRLFLENDVAEILKKIGWINENVSFDGAGPFYNRT